MVNEGNRLLVKECYEFFGALPHATCLHGMFYELTRSLKNR